MTDKFPNVRFGDKPPVDWRDEDFDDIDPDDEQIETPEDVIELLGFDPAEDELAEDEEWEPVDEDDEDWLAEDEAKFEESKHPRDPEGKFTSGGGTGKKSKAEHGSQQKLILDMLNKEGGVTANAIKQALGWKAIGLPAKAKALGIGLMKTKKGGETYYKAVPLGKTEEPDDIDVLLKKLIPTESKPEPEPKEEPEKPKGIMSMLEAHGYKLGKSGVNEAVFEKGDAKVKTVDSSSGDGVKWLSVSPGKQPKTGFGWESLEELLEGKLDKSKHTNVPNANFENWPNEVPKTPKFKMPKSKQKEGHDILKKLAKNQPTPTIAQKTAMSQYVGSGYSSMNSNLRAGGSMSGYAKELNSFLEKCELPEQVTCWRTVGGQYAEILKSIMIEGTVFRDKGFSSTTVDPHFDFKSGLKFEITAPKGANGAHVNNLSESELLFKAGCVYKVKSFDGFLAKVDMLLEHPGA